jgi:paraquat-inducible protein B
MSDPLIVSMLRQVPDVVWSAIIAAGIALFVTMLSNRNSRKQIKMQLDETARQRESDRAMTLRRDVYLPAIEAVVRAHGALGQITDLNSDVTAIGRHLVADIATMAKVHLVAKESTVKELLEFQKRLMPAYIELIGLRIPLVNRLYEIKVQKDLIDKTLAAQDRFLQLMVQVNLSSNNDPGALQRLNMQFANEQTNFQTHSTALRALEREQALDQLAVVARLNDLSGNVAQSMPDALISAREELGLPIHAETYRALLAEQQQVVQDTMRAFIKRIKASIDNTPTA